MLASAILVLLPLAAAVENQLSWLPHRRQEASPDVPGIDHWEGIAESEGRSLCFVTPDKLGGDDALAIAEALNKDCRSKSLVVLPGPVYHMKSNITTNDLDDVHINLFGRLLWSTDIDYWLSVSMPVGFQNQSTVWYFGGDNVVLDGHGFGTLDGNGQVWYDWAAGRGNLPHRPMMINWRRFTNSVVKRMNFVQSQMWTMATTWSHNLLFEDIYVNNTSSSDQNTLNTDGVDTIYSDNITFNRWDVTCGDDNIALKGNSSNIYVYDSVFRGGQGFAIGSLGQYNGAWEYIDNFYASNITMHDTTYAIYLKTWPGNQNGYPPNGGGGGLGHGQHITLEDITLDQTRTAAFWIWQCEHYEGNMGKDCDSSKFSFSDILYRNVHGTMASGVNVASSFRCSEASGGCSNITVENFGVTKYGTNEKPSDWWCSNVHDYEGFDCEPFPEEEQQDLSTMRDYPSPVTT